MDAVMAGDIRRDRGPITIAHLQGTLDYAHNPGALETGFRTDGSKAVWYTW